MEVNMGDKPGGVRGVSIDELDRLGIHEKTGRLYWDGKEVVMRTEFFFSKAAQRLGGIVVTAAGVGAFAASVTALVNVIRLCTGR
jgi:hypothetical protein